MYTGIVNIPQYVGCLPIGQQMSHVVCEYLEVMATKIIPFRVEPDLYKCALRRCIQLGFPSVSDYQKSLLRYDLLIARPHLATGTLCQYTPDEQAKFDQRLARAFLSGETRGGLWLERALANLIADTHPGKEPNITDVDSVVKKMMKDT